MKYIYICIIILFQSNFVFAEDEITSTWGNDINQNIFEQKPSALTEKQRASVIKKIANKSQLFYVKLLEKVEEAIEKTKNEELKARLEEVRSIIKQNIVS